MNNEDNAVIQAAKQYQQASTQYLTMRQIGKLFGVSSHVVGRKLKEVGLRDAEGHPTERAKESGYTKTVFVEERFSLTLWHQERALAVLRPLIEQQN